MSTQNTHFGASKINEYLSSCRKIFFCGIGGISMSSLASYTLSLGCGVVGYDRVRSALTDALSAAGADISYEHDAPRVDDCGALVYTVAMPEDTPELVRARALGIPCISRSDYLGYVMTRCSRRIGVCGTHGKSTTTAMLESVFTAAHRDPVVMCGANMASCGSAYLEGRGDDFIFEACEYMDSFLDFNPTTALVLNVELDHVDYFHSMEQMRRSYANFAALTGEDGYAVVNADEKNAVLALEGYRGTLLTYGVKDEASDITAKGITSSGGIYSFDLVYKGETLCRIDLSVPGAHNVSNALGAAGAALANGVSADDIARGLSAFRGISRRMEFKGTLNGARVYDDYAHHPTEILSTLSTARAMCGGRLICLFQSHTYSRTHELIADFARALSLADEVLVAPIYAAREENIYGVSQYTLAERIAGARGLEDFDECAKALKDTARAGDVVIVMGAGDITNVCKMLNLL